MGKKSRRGTQPQKHQPTSVAVGRDTGPLASLPRKGGKVWLGGRWKSQEEITAGELCELYIAEHTHWFDARVDATPGEPPRFIGPLAGEPSLEALVDFHSVGTRAIDELWHLIEPRFKHAFLQVHGSLPSSAEMDRRVEIAMRGDLPKLVGWRHSLARAQRMVTEKKEAATTKKKKQATVAATTTKKEASAAPPREARKHKVVVASPKDAAAPAHDPSRREKKLARRRCVVCGVVGSVYEPAFAACDGCGGPRFCGSRCQAVHWDSHKYVCYAERITKGGREPTTDESREALRRAKLHGDKENLGPTGFLGKVRKNLGDDSAKKLGALRVGLAAAAVRDE